MAEITETCECGSTITINGYRRERAMKILAEWREQHHRPTGEPPISDHQLEVLGPGLVRPAPRVMTQEELDEVFKDFPRDLAGRSIVPSIATSEGGV